MKNDNVRLYAACAEKLKNRGLLEAALCKLSDDRREKALRIRNEDGQRLSVCAGLLLKAALIDSAEMAGTDSSIFREHVHITYRENEKPYIDGTESLFFNLSHSGNMAVCAVAPCEVGCDIEKVKPDRTRIAERYFSETERIFAKKSEQNFFRMWTLKESFLKVTGKGLALALDSFSIAVTDEGITVVQNVDQRDYSFIEYSGFEGYCCSVCAAEGNISFDRDVRTFGIQELIGF